MLFEYETQRLLLKIIKPEYGSSVLEFYLRDKALFERYEPDRMLQETCMQTKTGFYLLVIGVKR